MMIPPECLFLFYDRIISCDVSNKTGTINVPDIWESVFRLFGRHGARVLEHESADHFTTERVLEAIETCRKDGTLFGFPEDLQYKCAAFFLTNSDDLQHRRGVYQYDTERVLVDWRTQ
jgi:hypothetical protein